MYREREREREEKEEVRVFGILPPQTCIKGLSFDTGSYQQKKKIHSATMRRRTRRVSSLIV